MTHTGGRTTTLEELERAAAVFDVPDGMKLGIGTMDLRIAAVAWSRNLTVVGRNLSEFGKVPGLRVEDWSM